MGKFIIIGGKMFDTDSIQSAELMSPSSDALRLTTTDNGRIFVSCSSSAVARECLERIVMAKNGIVVMPSSASDSCSRLITKIETDHQRAK